MQRLTGRLRMSYCEAGWTGPRLLPAPSLCMLLLHVYVRSALVLPSHLTLLRYV